MKIFNNYSTFYKTFSLNKTIWLIVLIVVVAATVLIVYFVRNTSNTRITYCGPNKTNPVSIFVNPDQAFPSFASNYQVKLQAGVNLLDTLSIATGGNVSSEVQTEIVELREKLNQDNIRMENLMRACFYAYNSRPCDPEVSRRYLNMLDTLALKITELEKLKVSVKEPLKGSTVPKDSALTSNQVTADTVKLKNALTRFRKISLEKNFVRPRAD